MGDYNGDDTTGFTSPAQDYVEPALDLVREFGLRQPGRYPVQFKGQGISRRSILAGDLLITDAAADPIDGQVCVAFVHGERVLAEIVKRDGRWWVQREGREPVEVSDDVEVWAAVTTLVRKL